MKKKTYFECLLRGCIYPGLFVGFSVFQDGLSRFWIIPAAAIALLFPFAWSYVDYLMLKIMTSEKKKKLESKTFYARLDLGALYYLALTLLTPILAPLYFIHKLKKKKAT